MAVLAHFCINFVKIGQIRSRLSQLRLKDIKWLRRKVVEVVIFAHFFLNFFKIGLIRSRLSKLRLKDINRRSSVSARVFPCKCVRFPSGVHTYPIRSCASARKKLDTEVRTTEVFFSTSFYFQLFQSCFSLRPTLLCISVASDVLDSRRLDHTCNR